jgi:hypothetical protein
MVHESLRKLRLDRRLLHRRGWIGEEELTKDLATLPDVSDKIAPPEEAHAEGEAETSPKAPAADEDAS